MILRFGDIDGAEAMRDRMYALFLLTQGGNLDRIKQELSDFEYDFEVIDTNLSPEDDERLRETFAAEEVAG